MNTDSTKEEDITYTCGDRCNKGVKGYRIYAAVLFKIELAADLSVYYKTVDGKPLNDIFPPRIEEMKPGKEYIVEPPTHAGYTYVGYKKTTDGSDPAQAKEITSGNPPRLAPYTGSFEHYRIYQYYTIGEPCQPGQTRAENAQCKEEPSPSDGTGACQYHILPPARTEELSHHFLNPQAGGRILGDDRANGRHFDATRGIPTSEHLYAQVWGSDYIFQHTFANMKGNIRYDCEVPVRYSLKWEEKNNQKKWKTRTASQTQSYTFSFTREYAYWQIQQLDVLAIQQAQLANYALPGGTLTLSPSAAYVPPVVFTQASPDVNDHVRPKATGSIRYRPGTLNGGKSGRPSVPNDQGKLQRMAERQTDAPDVRNDTVQFRYNDIATEVMKGQWGKAPTAVPQAIPLPPFPSADSNGGKPILFAGAQLISSKLANRANTPSTGTLSYTMLDNGVNGDGDRSFPITGMNAVTVHTPVVTYASVSDDRAHNQKTVPSTTRMALILNRPFTVRLPTTGQHREGTAYPGYGKRDFARYIKAKQVWFPFDVYSQDRSTLYPKQTWIDLPVQRLDTVFQLPIWIDEGNYTIAFRTIAENAPTRFTVQQDANTDLSHHAAKDTIDVEVIGRVYDFHVTGLADFNWDSVFRVPADRPEPTGASYWVGRHGIDGQLRGNERPYILPILRGSHPLPGAKNLTVSTGYPFQFDLKTIGNMFGLHDAIRIRPTFYYQDRSAATPPERVPVDLYYHSATQPFVKIGSEADTERRNLILNSRQRPISERVLLNTAASIYALSSGWKMSEEEYVAHFLKRASQPVYTGHYGIQLLTSPLRTFIAATDLPQTASVSPARVQASVQQWYGEYSLPARVYAVPKGTDLAAYARSHGGLDEKSPIFLKQGYIVVNMNIETIVNGEGKHPHLQYIDAPLSNQWWDHEGYDNTDGQRDHLITDAYGVHYQVGDGDVLFYDTDHGVDDQYTSRGTH